MQCSATSRWRLFVGLVVVPCLLAMTGCGGRTPARGPTGSVSGKVTLNGKPVPEGCAVVFMNQEKTVPASGVTRADGAYTVSNALAGANKITVTPPAKASSADTSNPEAYKAMMM